MTFFEYYVSGCCHDGIDSKIYADLGGRGTWISSEAATCEGCGNVVTHWIPRKVSIREIERKIFFNETEKHMEEK